MSVSEPTFEPTINAVDPLDETEKVGEGIASTTAAVEGSEDLPSKHRYVRKRDGNKDQSTRDVSAYTTPVLVDDDNLYDNHYEYYYSYSDSYADLYLPGPQELHISGKGASKKSKRKRGSQSKPESSESTADSANSVVPSLSITPPSVAAPSVDSSYAYTYHDDRPTSVIFTPSRSRVEC